MFPQGKEQPKQKSRLLPGTMRKITSLSHANNGDWPSGKATGSGPVIGVRIARGNSQGSPLLQTGLQSCGDGLAGGESNPIRTPRTFQL